MDILFQLSPHMISNTGIIVQLNERKIKKEKNPWMTITNNCQFTEETRTQKPDFFFTHGAFKTVSKLLRQQVTWHHLAFQLILGGESREVYECEKHTDFFLSSKHFLSAELWFRPVCKLYEPVCWSLDMRLQGDKARLQNNHSKIQSEEGWIWYCWGWWPVEGRKGILNGKLLRRS